MVSNGIWSTGGFFPLLYQFQAATWVETDGTIPLKHGSTTGGTKSFGFFNKGVACAAPDILVSDGIPISQRGKRDLSS